MESNQPVELLGHRLPDSEKSGTATKQRRVQTS